MSDNKKPAIRFKGFKDDWEQRKVPELLKNNSSAMKIGPFGSALKKEYFVEKGVKVYAQENVFTGDFSIGNYYITEEKYKELQSCELNQGDLVISMMGTIGACAIFPKTAEKGIMNSHLLRLQFSENAIPEYIMLLLRDSDFIKKQIDKLSVGSIMSGLSSSVVKKLVFPIPKYEEQKKIAEYFHTLDHLITLHQRKYERLQVLKKAMLEKMFPKNGSKVPEIRFEGFTDDWEQRKLTEFVEFFSGLTYTPSDVQENGTLVLRSSNVSNGEIVDADNVYVNSKVVNSENVKVGDIIVVVRNGSRSLIGKHAQIKTFMPNTVIGAFMTGIRSECPEFTNALLNTPKFEEEIAMNMGATINQITGYMFSKMEFKVPCLEEQKKIGTYFKHLDHLITLHQRQLEKLQNIKKSMLEKMFV